MESADSRQRIAAGAWGQRHGRPAPSFWCRVLSSPPPSSGKQQFLLLHADAAKFRAQHPLCYGVPLRSQGTPTNVAKQKGLITVKPPPTAVATAGWKRGKARRDDEVVELTEAGRACLRSTNSRKQSRHTVVWSRQYICGGVNTWRCVANAIVRRAPDHGSGQVGGVPIDSVIVAGTTKEISAQTWVQPKGERGWICAVAVLEAVGCVRQCGGVCCCAPDCTRQVKSRHACNFQLCFSATVAQVDSGHVQATLTGVHSASADWAALPVTHRKISPPTRDKIARGVALKQTAKQAQLSLDMHAREMGAATNERGAVVDRSLVPSRAVIQQMQTDMRRTGSKGVPAFETCAPLLPACWPGRLSARPPPSWLPG
eukprot:COSAG01_NODE_475_length_16519_cov_168.890621_11_plen_371_part_00